MLLLNDKSPPKVGRLLSYSNFEPGHFLLSLLVVDEDEFEEELDAGFESDFDSDFESDLDSDLESDFESDLDSDVELPAFFCAAGPGALPRA